MTTATVTTSPSEIIPANNARKFIAVQPIGGDIFIKIDGSDSTLTTSNGLQVTDGQLLILANDAGGTSAFTNAVEAVCVSATVDVRIQGHE